MSAYGLLDQIIRGLGADEFEELTLRLARKKYPDAHRTGSGGDDGVDVVSSMDLRPERGWQSKAPSGGKADWAKCAASLKAAMDAGPAPPHYTFVFSHRLSERQRQHWRDEFLPTQLALYDGQLETLDCWHDLARCVESHVDIVDWLMDGALGVYVRRVLAGQGAVSPPPRGPGPGTARAAAEYSEQLGVEDPRFLHGVGGRQASDAEAEPPQGRVQYTMSAGQRDALPRFVLTLRDGNLVQEVTATARDGTVRAPEPWFADTPDGERARALARASLARGRPIVLSGSHVGVSGGDVPGHFQPWIDEPGSGSGTLELGLSEPLELTLTLSLPDLGDVPERLTIYRVPPEPGAELAYAGAVGGAVLALDLVPGEPPADVEVELGAKWINCIFSVTLAVHREPAAAALRGLGFARAFGEAEVIRFVCPGLLPDDGFEIPGQTPPEPDAAETWEVAATLALALDGLRRRDGIERVMPESVGPRDLSRARVVLQLLEGEVAIEATGEFPAPLPPNAKADDDPARWMTFVTELPPLLGQPTGLLVEQRIEDATPLRIEPTDRGSLALICLAEGTARMVSRLVDADTGTS